MTVFDYLPPSVHHPRTRKQLPPSHWEIITEFASGICIGHATSPFQQICQSTSGPSVICRGRIMKPLWKLSPLILGLIFAILAGRRGIRLSRIIGMRTSEHSNPYCVLPMNPTNDRINCDLEEEHSIIVNGWIRWVSVLCSWSPPG
jgi:hypothetical protein